jgi:hypothetical protein
MEHVATNQTLITTRLTMKLFSGSDIATAFYNYQADEAEL